ncbi:hypothetical protein DdX_14234 [Ditylenchus destructor]|uniref:Uncharacterized protein n=1 Tax=Ditylenchus destructor TaxID=166010 RepID=A0AAD4MSI9_9BILA|nr:hypothetical protein DdX_14234 [Ditylenchus destructor]
MKLFAILTWISALLISIFSLLPASWAKPAPGTTELNADTDVHIARPRERRSSRRRKRSWSSRSWSHGRRGWGHYGWGNRGWGGGYGGGWGGGYPNYGGYWGKK